MSTTLTLRELADARRIKLFIAKVDKGDLCWQWTASTNASGYGTFATRRGSQLAHRVSFLLHCGDIPPGMCVLHRCDNRRCVNPAHLFLGTHTQNMEDMKVKGRAVGHRGERNPRAILTERDVQSIRDEIANGVSQKSLAFRYAVSKQTISAISRNRNWKHAS